jgi:hypothetical protein
VGGADGLRDEGARPPSRVRLSHGAFEPPDPDLVAAAEAAEAEAQKDGPTLRREALRLAVHADLLEAETARRYGPGRKG